MRPLVVLRQPGIALVRLAFAAMLQGFGHRPMQQLATCPADVAIDHFAHLVVAEVVHPAFAFLAQQVALHERLHRVEQRPFRLARHFEQDVEVEAPAEDGGDFERRPELAGHVRESRAHGGAQCVREQSAGRRSCAIPAASRPRCRDCRIDIRKNGLPSVSRCRRCGQSRCGELASPSAATRVSASARSNRASGTRRAPRLAAQALDESREPLVAVELLVAIRVDHEHRSLGDVTGEVVEHLRARVVRPLDVVHHQNERPTFSRRLEKLVHRARKASLACLGEIARQLRQVRKSFGHRGHQCGELGERHGREVAQRGRRRAVERARDEVDDGLVGNRPLDLVAVRRERRAGRGLPRSARPRASTGSCRCPARLRSGRCARCRR